MSEIPGQSGYALPNFEIRFAPDFDVAVSKACFPTSQPSIRLQQAASNPFGQELIRRTGLVLDGERSPLPQNPVRGFRGERAPRVRESPLFPRGFDVRQAHCAPNRSATHKIMGPSRELRPRKTSNCAAPYPEPPKCLPKISPNPRCRRQNRRLRFPR